MQRGYGPLDTAPLNRTDTLSLRLPPQPDLCCVARRRIAAFARAKGVAEDDLSSLLSAVGEALANAVEHGKTPAPLDIECRVEADRIFATVSDAGVGFEREPELLGELPDVESERGRGLGIMRRLSDTFAVSRLPGGGTSVLVGRYLRHPLNVRAAGQARRSS